MRVSYKGCTVRLGLSTSLPCKIAHLTLCVKVDMMPYVRMEVCVKVSDIQAHTTRVCVAIRSRSIVHDAGRTQIASGSATVLAIGPGETVRGCKCVW